MLPISRLKFGQNGASARRGYMNRVLESVIDKLVPNGNLRITLPNGRELEFGDGEGELVVARFTDAAAVRALMLDPDLRLGELYMDGRLVIERGTIFDFLVLLLRNSAGDPDTWWTTLHDYLRYYTRGLFQHNVGRRSKDNVAHHYDLDDRLYELFLDTDRQYSCAYFETGKETLDQAQLEKKRHIAAKLCLEPGQSILDIGCGWGGMALYLAEAGRAGKVLGVTLSEEQLKVAQRRARDAGLDDRVQFALQDYRKLEGSFDRIVSVGMFEHVGAGYYDTYFQTAHKLLKPNGVMLLHTIGSSDKPAFTNPWIQKYIFPGGYIPSMSEALRAIERARLVVTDVEVLRLHYAKTLHHWRDRFLARREEAKKFYDERFCRMWEFYLAASETAFLYQDTVVFQFQLARKQDNVPLTRSYLVPSEAALAGREKPPTP
jgi:cyclopropane-fatty-acyl-phospholipid synthase